MSAPLTVISVALLFLMIFLKRGGQEVPSVISHLPCPIVSKEILGWRVVFQRLEKDQICPDVPTPSREGEGGLADGH